MCSGAFILNHLMEKNQYKYMFEAEDRHWWYVGNHKIFTEILIRNTILKNDSIALDAGCGTGKWLEILKNNFKITTFGIDYSETALQYAKLRGLDNLQQADVNNYKTDTSFDLITSFDVICSNHVNEDTTIKNFYNLLNKNGYLLLTVPAYRFMLSRHDQVVHQNKRFRRKQIKMLLESNGFEVIKISYVVCLLFPLAFIRRMLNKLFASVKYEHNEVKVPVNFNNSVFLFIMGLEKIMLRYFSLPFGLSVMVLAKKTA